MLAQNIKALCLFISVAMMVFGVSEYSYDTQSFLGFVWSALGALLLSNIVDLIDKWHGERRKDEITPEERENWMFKRQSD